MLVPIRVSLLVVCNETSKADLDSARRPWILCCTISLPACMAPEHGSVSNWSWNVRSESESFESCEREKYLIDSRKRC